MSTSYPVFLRQKEFECGCLDQGTGRFLLVALGAISLMVAGGLCLYAGVNAYGSFGLLASGTFILIVDVIVWQCKALTCQEEEQVYFSQARTMPPSYPSEYFSTPLYLPQEPINQTQLEELTMGFYQEFLQISTGLNSLWVALLNNNIEGTLDQKAALLIDSYLESKKGENVNSATKRALLGSFLLSLAAEKKGAVSREIPFEQGTLEIFNTLGDGSCGIHALFGKLENGYVRCNAREKRDELCKLILEANKNGQLQEHVKNVLDEYFFYWDRGDVPLDLKTPQNNALRKELFEKFNQEKQESERAEICEAFRQIILPGYLNNLKQIGHYLTQVEMLAVIQCFKEDMILIQPGWHNDKQRMAWQVFQKGELVDVIKGQTQSWEQFCLSNDIRNIKLVYFNGINHYEQAFIKRAPRPPIPARSIDLY